jgi:hypothetical protein
MLGSVMVPAWPPVAAKSSSKRSTMVVMISSPIREAGLPQCLPQVAFGPSQRGLVLAAFPLKLVTGYGVPCPAPGLFCGVRFWSLSRQSLACRRHVHPGNALSYPGTLAPGHWSYAHVPRLVFPSWPPFRPPSNGSDTRPLPSRTRRCTTSPLPHG